MKKLLVPFILLFAVSCSLEKFERPVEGSDLDISDESQDFNDIDVNDEEDNEHDEDYAEDDSDIIVSDINGVICTGQTKCYNEYLMTSCPPEGSDYFGTDGYYASKGMCLQRNLDAVGPDPDKTVLDSNTGLEWIRNLPVDKYDWESAFKYCKDSEYAGYSDWRLPDYKELRTLVYYGKDVSLAIEDDLFPSTPESFFWTFSVDRADSMYSWYVDFMYGTSGKMDKKGLNYVRCVRGNILPENSFVTKTAQNNEIITDESTKLIWSSTVFPVKTWREALGYCKDLNYGGSSAWRLPSANELISLVDIRERKPASLFPDLPFEKFWSSTTDSSYYSQFAVAVDFESGSVAGEVKTDENYVICVTDEIEDDIELESCINDDDCEDGFECFEDICIPEKSFISKWNTAFYGVSSEKQIMLPLVENGTYDFTVFWGDGKYNKITKWNDSATTHTYPESGIYTVVITGTFKGWQFCEVTETGCAVSDATKIIDISRWGGLVLGDTEFQFAQCWNLDITAEDTPDLSKTKSLRGAFANCKTLADSESFADWDVSEIQNMNGMFYQADKFNQDISGWDVSNVTDMSYAFFSAGLFNADLSNWDVSKVTDMSNMFENAAAFNSDISDWNVSNVTDMSYAFSSAILFNADLSNWDVSKVTDMSNMFENAAAFNSDISDWNVSNVTDMGHMFEGAAAFNGDLSDWDVSNVTDMSWMFYAASSFNSDLSKWNVSKVINMDIMFFGAVLFNSDLSNWDVSEVKSMGGMFSVASSFNGNISNWDVSNVNIMNGMFSGASKFNSDLSNWDVSNVTDMSHMFESAAVFNSDLSSWNVSKVEYMNFMFDGALLFDQDISSWDVSNVTEMRAMIGRAESFNQDISGWDVSGVKDMVGMFGGAKKFNQDISSWDVSNVNDMSAMFASAESFDKDISSWDVSQVTDMSMMFQNAKKFDCDLNKWDVSKVTDMYFMFNSALLFNGNISSWNVANVENMEGMFGHTQVFNKDLNEWDVSNVKSMQNMFYGAKSFDQDLSSWDVSNVTNMSFMFYDVTLSTANYDAILNGWSELVLQNDVDFHGGNSKYSSAAEAARAKIISDFNWTITDGGKE